MNASNDSEQTNIVSMQFDALKWLGERRDGFLVGGAILYGLGYVVWSYNAWRNQLGQLPALEFQYVASGIIPAGILALAWAGMVFFSKIRTKVEALYGRHGFLKWLVPIGVGVVQQATVFLAKDQRWGHRLYHFFVPVLAIFIYFSVMALNVYGSMFTHFIQVIISVYRYFPSCFAWFRSSYIWNYTPACPKY